LQATTIEYAMQVFPDNIFERQDQDKQNREINDQKVIAQFEAISKEKEK